MISFQETERRDWIVTIALISLSIAAIAIGAIFLISTLWYLWIIIVAFIVLILVNWHSKTFGYRCTKCREEFGVTFLTELISAHGISKKEDGTSYGWYYLKCPKCKEKSKAIVIKKVKK
jgi:ABC-type transport system involved in cytochrome bd biosynthesis fused ATPase/permease subunit